jgi:hypothetical protein
MPRHICGGTYRDRTKRRNKAPGEKRSCAETKKRRIERKFGVAGKGKSLAAGPAAADGRPKPRVAQSNRGRELRAAAALARLAKDAKEEQVQDEDEGEEGDTASESDGEKAVDVGGGAFMIAVSGGQDGKQERDEMDRELIALLGGACGQGSSRAARQSTRTNAPKHEPDSETPIIDLSSDTEESTKQVRRPPSPPKPTSNAKQPPAGNTPHAGSSKHAPAPPSSKIPPSPASPTAAMARTDVPQTCPVCSCANCAGAATCVACMNVLLDGDDVLAAWNCRNASCPPLYRNSGDVVFCGACGDRRR